MPSRSIRSPREAPLRGRLAALVLALSLGEGPAARAQSPADVKQAQAHHRTGEAAFNAGRFEEAIAEWERGYALVPKPLFVVNLAHAERRRGELRKSLALYRRYLLVDPETEVRGEVERVIAELEQAIAAEDAARAPRPPPRPAAPAPPEVAPAPALVAPSAPPVRASPPLYKRWWVWTAAAAVVGGAAAGVWLLR